jgi:hypothetical protein
MFFDSLIKYFLLIALFVLYSCSTVRESAGVTRKSIDEFQTIENPPLVIPPNFDLKDPSLLREKEIDNVDQELAEEILFGLDEKKENSEIQLSTMKKILLEADADNVSSNIRDEIDNDFANEKKTKGLFNVSWEKEVDILDAIKESERIRNKNFDGELISEGEIPIKKETIKTKKKKRFLIF